jgi:hypothetical protein
MKSCDKCAIVRYKMERRPNKNGVKTQQTCNLCTRPEHIQTSTTSVKLELQLFFPYVLLRPAHSVEAKT